MTKNNKYQLDINNIPFELRNIPRWVMWRYIEKKFANGPSNWTKVPYSTLGRSASVSNTDTWNTFEEVVKTYNQGSFAGIGLVLGDDVQGIDLDDHRDAKTGKLSEFALELLKRIDGYAEVSPSGTGIKIFTRSNLTSSKVNHDKGVEIYNKGRYFTVTGLVIKGHENLPSEVQDLSWLVRDISNQDRLSQIISKDINELAFSLHKSPIDGWNLERVQKEILIYIDPDSGYHDWLTVGQALHHQGQGDEAWLTAWDEWSTNSNKYQVGVCETKWRSFHKQRYSNNGVITLATLLKRTKNYLETIKPIEISRQFRLLSAKELSQQPPLQWIVKHVFPKTGLAVIYGQSGTGKSFLALDLALAVSNSASDWFGQKINPCTVTYCILEGQAGMGKRITAWEKHSKKVAPEGVRFTIQSFNLVEPGMVPALADAILKSGSGEMIILDTLARATPGVDENSSKEMGTVISAATHLQELTGGLVVLVAHSGKNPNNGVRGHSSLFAAADAVIKVTRSGSQRVWELEKSKDDVDGLSYEFKLESVTLDIDEDLEKVESPVVISGSYPYKKRKTLSSSQKLGIKTLQNAISESPRNFPDNNIGAHEDDWRHYFYKSCTADRPSSKSKSFQRARKDLTERKIIRMIDDIYIIEDDYFRNVVF